MSGRPIPGWDALRARVGATLPRACAKCGFVIRPGEPWDLGHQVAVVNGGAFGPVAPEHRRCNRAQGSQIARKRIRRTSAPSRAW